MLVSDPSHAIVGDAIIQISFLDESQHPINASNLILGVMLCISGAVTAQAPLFGAATKDRKMRARLSFATLG